jgi:hypothetical protein
MGRRRELVFDAYNVIKILRESDDIAEHFESEWSTTPCGGIAAARV